MNRAKRLLSLIAIAVLLLPATGWTLECQSPVTQVKAVNAGARITTVDFAGSGGQLDPVPLLQTTIIVGGTTASCVIAHFSAMAQPNDNHIVFQTSIDDVPMAQHARFPFLNPSPATPVVWDPEETNLNLPRMVSYSFLARVNPGIHTVRVRFAGCCSSATGNSGIVRSAVLTLEYR